MGQQQQRRLWAEGLSAAKPTGPPPPWPRTTGLGPSQGPFPRGGGGAWDTRLEQCLLRTDVSPPPLCNSYAKVRNEYGPYAYCSYYKGVACARHIKLPTYT